MGFAPMFFRLRPGYTEVNLNGKDYVLYCSSLVPRLLPRKMGRAVFLVRNMEMKLVWFVMICYCNTLRLQLVVHCDWLYTGLAAPRTPLPLNRTPSTFTTASLCALCLQVSGRRWHTACLVCTRATGRCLVDSISEDTRWSGEERTGTW